MFLTRSILVLALLVACGTPDERADRAGAGWARAIIQGSPFEHLTYFKSGQLSNKTLHIYIEHDGTPWVLGSEINADPTPRKLIMLDLMKQDSAPALYLGRPCYFSVASSPPCAPRHWTYERYSSEIVESMANVLEKFLAAHPFDKVRLFGLSGGGTLVTLLAHRLPQPIAVVAAECWASLRSAQPTRPVLRASRSGSSFACHLSQMTSISALLAMDFSVMCGTRS